MREETDPTENDYAEALKLNANRPVTSEQLWDLAHAVQRLRALGPSAPEAPGRVHFSVGRRPFFDKAGRRIVHVGARYSNGLIGLCSEIAIDTTPTFVSAERLESCPECTRAIDIGERLTASRS